MTAEATTYGHEGPPVRGPSARVGAADVEEGAAVREARGRLRALAQGELKNRGLTIRRAFLRNAGAGGLVPVAGQLAMAPGGDGTGPGPDGLALRVMLLALWAAGGQSPRRVERFNPRAAGRGAHSTALLPAEDLVAFLAIMSSPSTANRRISDAVGHLRAAATYAAVVADDGDQLRPATTRSPLLEVSWEANPDARGWTLRLLNELGTGGDYVQPAVVQRTLRDARRKKAAQEEFRKLVESLPEERRPWWVDGLDLETLTVPFEQYYFRLEPEFITNGWLTVLPTPALHLYLYLCSQVISESSLRPGSQPTQQYRDRNWVVPTRHTYEHAVRLLARYGLITAVKRRYGRRTVYDVTLEEDASYVTRFAPLVRTPKTRMLARELDDWLQADKQRRAPSDSLLEKLTPPRASTD